MLSTTLLLAVSMVVGQAEESNASIQNIPVDAVEWSESQGGNGHFYKVVSVRDGITWSEANKSATGAGGHLATITSSDENDFVAKLADASQFWGHPPNWTISRVGPWLGGLQQQDGKWRWVTGEAFEFTNWHEREPNTHLFHEEATRSLNNCISFYARRTESPTGRSPMWSDNPSGQDYIAGYVVEFDEFGACGASKQTRDKKWDHRAFTQRSVRHLMSELKVAEGQGWELVSVIHTRTPWGDSGFVAFLKRPVSCEPTRTSATASAEKPSR